MDRDDAPKPLIRCLRVAWGGARSRSFIASDRWLNSFTSQGQDWLQGPVPATRDYGPRYEVKARWEKVIFVVIILTVIAGTVFL